MAAVSVLGTVAAQKTIGITLLKLNFKSMGIEPSWVKLILDNHPRCISKQYRQQFPLFNSTKKYVKRQIYLDTFNLANSWHIQGAAHIAQAFGHGEHPLTHWQTGKNVVGQVRGCFGHTASVARRTDAAPFTG